MGFSFCDKMGVFVVRSSGCRPVASVPGLVGAGPPGARFLLPACRRLRPGFVSRCVGLPGPPPAGRPGSFLVSALSCPLGRVCAGCSVASLSCPGGPCSLCPLCRCPVRSAPFRPLRPVRPSCGLLSRGVVWFRVAGAGCARRAARLAARSLAAGRSAVLLPSPGALLVVVGPSAAVRALAVSRG